MNDKKYLRLKSKKDNKRYNIRLGEIYFIGTEDTRDICLKEKGADFYSFMLEHIDETFEILGTKSVIYINYFKEWEGSELEYTYLGASLSAVTKKGITINSKQFIINHRKPPYEPHSLDEVLSLPTARCCLVLDRDSNSLFAVPMESHYSRVKKDNEDFYTAVFHPAPYDFNEQPVQVPDETRRRVSPTTVTYPWTFYPFTTNFTSYEDLANGIVTSSQYKEGCASYCALRNFSDPNPDNPTIPPIDIEYGFPGEPSGPDGGGGEMTDTNEETELRPPGITNVKYFTRVYKLNASQISSLRDYLWSDNFITNLPKLFSDPFSAIIGLQALPLDIEGSASNVFIGSLDSGVNGIGIISYYNTVDLGYINVTEFWQSFLDYQPYTRLKLYLPYIGIVDLPTDQFMNNSIGIKYRIDVISGACVAVISNSTNIICQFTGNCATKMPISASDHASILSNSLVGLTAVAGNVAAGNVAGAVASSANVMLGLKEKIQISGSMATSHGILVNSTPYLMIERPTSNIPENYGALKGFTSNISLKLSACSGFTKVSEIKLDGISATDEEKTELLALLQSGVYI